METKENLDRRAYELAYLLNPGADKAEGNKLRNYLEEEKSFVLEEEPPSLIRLSYPIEKKDEAYFGWFKFLISAGELDKIEKKIKNNPNVLRKLLVRSEKKESQPLAKPRRKSVGPREKIQMEEIDRKLEELLSKI